VRGDSRLDHDPDSAVVTEVGDWGPWIVGGPWLTVAGARVDLLYRCADAVRDVVRACRAGPAPLREALIRRFQWEVLFSVENAETAVGRGAQTHIAGCAYRALSCVVQVLFALNRRYFVNEKGALEEAADFPITLAGLTERVSFVWRAIGARTFGKALDALRTIEQELRAMTTSEQFR
jgi:hypothetical protein